MSNQNVTNFIAALFAQIRGNPESATQIATNEVEPVQEADAVKIVEYILTCGRDDIPKLFDALVNNAIQGMQDFREGDALTGKQIPTKN